MNLPPFTLIPAAQGKSSSDRGSILTQALVGGLFSRRQIRSITDRLISCIIKTGGTGVILCILGMYIFLVKEVVPLFQSPRAILTEPAPLSAPETSSSALIGIDEQQELAYVLHGNSLEFIFLTGATSTTSQSLSPRLIPDGSVTAVARALGK